MLLLKSLSTHIDGFSVLFDIESWIGRPIRKPARHQQGPAVKPVGQQLLVLSLPRRRPLGLCLSAMRHLHLQ